MILHYDTETTGLPVAGQPSEHPGQPHIVSLSAALDDAQGVTRRVMSVIVSPVGYRLEDFPEAQKIHGITTETADRYGIDLTHALAMFESMVSQAHVLSAFNHHFDHKLLKIACARTGNADLRAEIATKSSICTMEAAATYLTAKKRISLKNAYMELFKTEVPGAHTSLGDTFASRKIYRELVRIGFTMTPASLAEKVYDTPLAATA